MIKYDTATAVYLYIADFVPITVDKVAGWIAEYEADANIRKKDTLD